VAAPQLVSKNVPAARLGAGCRHIDSRAVAHGFSNFLGVGGDVIGGCGPIALLLTSWHASSADAHVGRGDRLHRVLAGCVPMFRSPQIRPS